MSKLTAKQSRFVSEYIIDFNATQAAVRSGYSDKTAYSIGAENLRKPEIKKAIKEHQETAANRNQTTVDTIDEMHKAAYRVAENQKQPSAMTQAAQNLAKLHGLITDRQDINITPPKIEYVVPDAP